MFKKLNESFKEKINKPLLISAFSLFIFILVWVVLLKCVGVARDQNIVWIGEALPKLNVYERFMYQFRFGTESTIGINNLEDNIENLIVFIPFGLFLPLLNHKNFSCNLLISFLVSFLIEIIQLITGLGGFELIDLVTNPMGYSVGYLFYLLIKRFLTPQVVNYICLIILIIFIPVMIYGYTEFFIKIELFKPFFSIDNYRNLFNFN